MDPHLRTAAVLLIGGWVIFWAGAMTPPWDWWYPIPAAEYLQLIEAHRWIWLWIAASFAVGVLLTLAGLVVLGTVLRAHGDGLWSDLGQTAFVFGSVLWVATILFRATATISAATEVAAVGLPDFRPLERRDRPYLSEHEEIPIQRDPDHRRPAAPGARREGPRHLP
jgi:hypothetical protein